MRHTLKHCLRSSVKLAGAGGPVLPVSWFSERWLALARIALSVGKAVWKFHPSQFHSPISVSVGRKALGIVEKSDC